MENAISGRLINGTEFTTYSPDDPELINILRSKNIVIDAKPPVQPTWWITLLSSIFPVILIIGVWIFMLKRMQGGANSAMSFGKKQG